MTTEPGRYIATEGQRAAAKLEVLRWSAMYGELEEFGRGELEGAKKRLAELEVKSDEQRSDNGSTV